MLIFKNVKSKILSINGSHLRMPWDARRTGSRHVMDPGQLEMSIIGATKVDNLQWKKGEQ